MVSQKESKMRIRLEQMQVLPGHPRRNTGKILNAIKRAKQDKVELILFPEMAVPGYLVGDEWERESFLRQCEECGKLIEKSSQGLVVVFGNIAIDWNRHNEDGRVRKYNSLFAAENGVFCRNPKTGYPHNIKTLLPNYREFDDNRHFYDPRKLAYELNCPVDELITPITTERFKLGGVLCEDSWDEDYNIFPLEILVSKGAEILMNISSSPYSFNKNSKRNRVFCAKAARLKLPLIYVNNVGIQDNGKTVYTFDGSSCVYDGKGSIAGSIPPFEEDSLTLDISLEKAAAFGQKLSVPEDGIDMQYRAIQYGTQKFMERLGIKKVVVGVSGGIDSAVVASLYRLLLPPENLLLVNMPGPFTSETTKRLAQTLAENLDCCYTEIPIQPSVDVTMSQVHGREIKQLSQSISLKLEVSNFVLENIQARDRSSRILAVVAAAFGGVFTCNANKSEITVGYSTLYGDLSGYLANIADLWKTEVYDLARFINTQVYQREVIPHGIIEIPPSAELSSEQNVDEGKGDPLYYPYHDCLFRSWVERWNRATPEDILQWYCSGTLETNIGYKGNIKELFLSDKHFIDDMEHWWKLYQGIAIAKRIQAPPVVSVKRRTFGFDHREAQLGPRFTETYLKLRNELLKKN